MISSSGTDLLTGWRCVLPADRRQAGGDSGELVAASCIRGHPHPPGYPLFTLLNHAFTQVLLCWHTPAWRANVLNGACNVGATSFIYLSVRRWSALLSRRSTKRTPRLRRLSGCWSAVSAALCYAFSPLVWLYGTGAEVFALNNLMCSLLVYLALRFATLPPGLGGNDAAVIGSFCCGLALCNQHTAVLFEIPLIVWILGTLVARGGHTLLPLLRRLTSAFVMGLTPYLYLPVQSVYFPKQTDWGDSSTLGGFFRHFRRADYGSFQLYSGDTGTGNAGMLGRTALYLRDVRDAQASYNVQLLSRCYTAVLRAFTKC